MKALTCPQCGGTLLPVPGENYYVCDSCETPTVASNIDNDKIRQLKERANRLFLACDFDGAATLYQSVVAEVNDDAESYWILALCTYGIQYVDDPLTKKKIPTCHRASHTSILNNEDYLNALDCADVLSRRAYEEAARRIDQIQQGILSIVEKETPYDVFICYKETSATGSRTQESEIAKDLYYKLMAAGYRTFYAPISLQDKAGLEYEPFIFSALITAKIMFVIGFSKEHFETVWVKNEWSRYLARKAKNPRLLLVSCYNSYLGMTANDLPELLKKTQGRDLANTSTNDLVADVQKKMPKNKPVVAKAQVDVSNIMSSNVTNMLKRAYIDLENGDFSDAKERFKRSSEMDAELSKAYWGLLLADFKCRNNAELVQLGKPITGLKTYTTAVRFANEQEQEEYQAVVRSITSKIERTLNALKEKRSKEIYATGVTEELINGEKNMSDLKSEYNQLIVSLAKVEEDLKHCIAECRRVIDPHRDGLEKLVSKVSAALSESKGKLSIDDDNKRIILQNADEDKKAINAIALEKLIQDKSEQFCYKRLAELLAEQKKISESLDWNIHKIKQQYDDFNNICTQIKKIEKRYQPAFEQVPVGEYRLASQLLE